MDLKKDGPNDRSGGTDKWSEVINDRKSQVLPGFQLCGQRHRLTSELYFWIMASDWMMDLQEEL